MSIQGHHTSRSDQFPHPHCTNSCVCPVPLCKYLNIIPPTYTTLARKIGRATIHLNGVYLNGWLLGAEYWSLSDNAPVQARPHPSGLGETSRPAMGLNLIIEAEIVLPWSSLHTHRRCLTLLSYSARTTLSCGPRQRGHFSACLPRPYLAITGFPAYDIAEGVESTVWTGTRSLGVPPDGPELVHRYGYRHAIMSR